MNHQNNRQNITRHDSCPICNSSTPPTTPRRHSQPQQQLPVQDTRNSSNTGITTSQSTSITSLSSFTSMDSTSSQVKREDELFDKIEDMLCEYMRDPDRHNFHCRVLRWSLDDDLSSQFSAVVVISPPVTKN